jgi:hypothetical protein
LVSFFARHPEFGVPFAEVTAARGRTIYERVIQSCEMLQLAADDCGLTRQERATADRALRKTLQQVIAALKLRFDRSDPRWNDFGLLPALPALRGKCRLRSKAAAPIPFVRHSHRSSQRIAAA